MYLSPYLLSVTLLTSALPANTELEHVPLDTLEQRLVEIDAELEQLAPLNLRGGVGSIGYRSDANATSEHLEWIQVDLESEFSIDEIVLVPCLSRSTEFGFQADGFPLNFRIIAGSGNEQTGRQIASYTEQDGLLPRIAPVVVSCSDTTASWVRIEADRLSKWGWNETFILQLSELLIFSGSENIALRKPLTSSTESPVSMNPWGARFLTDGFVPYLMDESHGEKSNAWLSPINAAQIPSLTIDLEEPQIISRIHLHAIELGDTIPHGHIGDFGMPKHLKIEAATKADFSDAVMLVDYQPLSIYEIGPIVMWNIPETRCRFVRLTALEPYFYNDGINNGPRIGFSEIEIFSAGKNVAYGMQISTNFEDVNPGRRLSALTDGHNFFGKTLPVRQWMQELARRHELETERPALMTELSSRYARQKTNLHRLSWLAAILTSGIGFTILIDRLIRLRQISHIKERLSADLHDELGANIHSIKMLSDLAQDTDSPDEWKSMHQRILQLANRTTKAIKYCTNTLEAKGLYIGLVEDMQRAVKRISGNFEHEFSVTGEQWLAELKPRTRVDIFLFYKEALINICRHSSATQVSTHLTANKNEITLMVCDNGQGLSGQTPSSLRRRARLMGAQVDVDTPTDGGTRITLRKKQSKFNILNWFRRAKLT